MAHFHQNTVLFPTEVESIYFQTKKFSYRIQITKSCHNSVRMCHYLAISPLIVTDLEMCFSEESVYL